MNGNHKVRCVVQNFTNFLRNKKSVPVRYRNIETKE